jgi:hypothetical protein
VLFSNVVAGAVAYERGVVLMNVEKMFTKATIAAAVGVSSSPRSITGVGSALLTAAQS